MKINGGLLAIKLPFKELAKSDTLQWTERVPWTG
jgi:hypothetical protein